jgi:hypothetical protein
MREGQETGERERERRVQEGQETGEREREGGRGGGYLEAMLDTKESCIRFGVSEFVKDTCDSIAIGVRQLSHESPPRGREGGEGRGKSRRARDLEMVFPRGIVAVKGIIQISDVTAIHVNLKNPLVTCCHPTNPTQ